MSRFTSQLSDSHVLLTGGNKGIGKVTVEAFLREGANVSYCGRSVRGDEFASYSQAADGALAFGTSVDIASSDSVNSWVEEAAQKVGRIDVVVANASPEFFDKSVEHWNKSFEANIIGLVSLIDAATPHLAASPLGGSIVVISSLAGLEARHPTLTGPYSTIKRAQASLAEDYSKVLAPRGVRVNTLVSGPVATPDTTLPDGTVIQSTWNAHLEKDPAFFDELYKTIPMSRSGRPEETANVVLFLASPLSTFVTGASVVVDGGLSIAY